MVTFSLPFFVSFFKGFLAHLGVLSGYILASIFDVFPIKKTFHFLKRNKGGFISLFAELWAYYGFGGHWEYKNMSMFFHIFYGIIFPIIIIAFIISNENHHQKSLKRRRELYRSKKKKTTLP